MTQVTDTKNETGNVIYKRNDGKNLFRYNGINKDKRTKGENNERLLKLKVKQYGPKILIITADEPIEGAEKIFKGTFEENLNVVLLKSRRKVDWY